MKNKDVAIMYDFDGTLAHGNMQEYNFIPKLKMTSEGFIQEVNELKERENMEGILAYMYLMLKKAEERNVSVTRDSFIKYGENVILYPGVEGWFKRLNQFAQGLGLNLHHFVISSGIKEMIEGTSISDEFERIYASSFLYNADSIAIWPSVAINYTNKTQFLFRINKGLYEVYDDKINEHMPMEEKSIDFPNMIYIGDGFTDVPCMRLVKDYNGTSIAVYESKSGKHIADELLKHNRVNYTALTDYTEGSDIDIYIKEKLKEIATRSEVFNDQG